MIPVIVLKPGRQRSVLRRHPWIFSGAVAKVKGDPGPGVSVDVVSSDGVWLARGAYSPNSQILVRIWTFDEKEDVSEGFFRSRIQKALDMRTHLLKDSHQGACRLINSESDGLPGVIVDFYSGFLVCQVLTAGGEFWKEAILKQLGSLISNDGIYERSDADVRLKEGLSTISGIISGKMPPDLIEIREGQCRFLVDVKHGHKTGFYLDQRENRATVAEYAKGLRVLNCFSYTGGFAVHSLMAGAGHVTNVDSSLDALRLAEQNIALNNINTDRVENITGDVFRVLRKFRDSGICFDMVILDPPKFADSMGSLKKAGRGYKDINLLAQKLLFPGGMLCTFCCSGLVTRELFQKIVSDAAIDAGRDVRIVRWLTQAQDHPCGVNFPEGIYLKGLICRVW
ncbi:Ribosomal RNA large subunit methyltransferase I [uncultured Desulfobacterium sp.]|uniref:Ribosomal RNA large subunit methyltransferase I n=1 Tax=uncultured Desulfobacterium sp. TaxID=201089 RepID=A0A445MTI2_9BACT|nr:Ribosomal RNA large subunit methyltransferase I [uncultured Desulfobacterium sp.]